MISIKLKKNAGKFSSSLQYLKGPYIYYIERNSIRNSYLPKDSKERVPERLQEIGEKILQLPTRLDFRLA